MVKPDYYSKMNLFANKIYEKVSEYGQYDYRRSDLRYELTENSAKVCFLGLNLYPNGNPIFINWDIIFLMKALQRRHIETRIHDPHIRGSEALSQGIWLGRQSEGDKWTHTYNVLILSCPHMFYIQNILKLAHLFKPEQKCLFLDLYGAFTRIGSIGDNIDIVNFMVEVKEAELMGGLFPLKSVPRIGNQETD